MKKAEFKVGSERLDAQGNTLRLCKTSNGKEQWRKIGEDGEPIKRGRKEGSKVLTEMTLHQLLQHIGGRKFATAVKGVAKETGSEAAFSAKILVASKWSAEAVKPEKETRSVATVEEV